MTGTGRSFTYEELLDEVATFAAVLAQRGVTKGDRVIVYMPMVPEAVIAMLAVARLGAVHSVVFGGFAANELATRIDDAKPVAIVSASCGLEPGRVVAYKPLLDKAIELSAHKPKSCIILQRPQEVAPLSLGRDFDWSALVGKAARGKSKGALRAGRLDRSALHPLHLRHDRPAERRRPRSRRAHGGARLVDAQHLRLLDGRCVLGRLRCRLGGRPLLHRLRAALGRLHGDPLRGQAGRHARCRRLLARRRRAQCESVVHGTDRLSGHQEGGSEGRADREV